MISGRIPAQVTQQYDDRRGSYREILPDPEEAEVGFSPARLAPVPEDESLRGGTGVATAAADAAKAPSPKRRGAREAEEKAAGTTGEVPGSGDFGTAPPVVVAAPLAAGAVLYGDDVGGANGGDSAAAQAAAGRGGGARRGGEGVGAAALIW